MAITNALGIYLSKFDDWKYCLPSDNLWTINFLLAPREDNATGSFSTLYSNIVAVNNQYDSMYSPLWKINTSIKDIDFITNSQDPNIGMFLASLVQFNGNEVQISDTKNETMVPHSGWASYGKTANGRTHGHGAKIRFLKSNWDISEIFFDRWIAAIGQQGLIEDSSLPNIKSTITINEYAASAPHSTDYGWTLRKRIYLLRAFPYKRGESSYKYDAEDAGTAKFCQVDFKFDAFQVEYFNAGATTKSNGTPGYVTASTAEGTSMVGPTITSSQLQGRGANTK